MPNTYNGNAAGVAAHSAVVLPSNPADGEAANAASNNTDIRYMADRLQYLMANGGLLNAVNTWLLGNSFQTGVDFNGAQPIDINGPVVQLNSNAYLAFTTNPTDRTLLLSAKAYATAADPRWVRVYASLNGALEITINANWYAGDFYPDSAAHPQSKLRLDPNGVVFASRAAGAGSFSDAQLETNKVVVLPGQVNSDVLFLPGNIVLNGNDPAGTDPLENRLTPLSFAKAIAVFTLSTGNNPTLLKSLNVTSVTRLATGQYRVTFAQDFADSNYGIQQHINAPGLPSVFNKDNNAASLQAGYWDFELTDATHSSAVDEAHFNGHRISLTFWGSQ